MTDNLEAIADLKKRYPKAETTGFGDSDELSGQLIALIRSGRKVATCSALRDYIDGEPRPEPGRCDIVLDWHGAPALIIKTIEVIQCRYCDITEEMALAEGEDENLEGWRTGHQAFFERNGGFSPEMELLWESFMLVEDLDIKS